MPPLKGALNETSSGQRYDRSLHTAHNIRILILSFRLLSKHISPIYREKKQILYVLSCEITLIS